MGNLNDGGTLALRGASAHVSVVERISFGTILGDLLLETLASQTRQLFPDGLAQKRRRTSVSSRAHDGLDLVELFRLRRKDGFPFWLPHFDILNDTLFWSTKL